MKKKLLNFVLVVSLCVISVIGGAYAAANNETISAMLNREIKITYNGEVQTFKDVSGNVVYPISYNGTTYLPVRAVSNLVKLPVNWDANNNTVILGSAENNAVNLVDREHVAPGTIDTYIISDAEMLKFAGSDAVQEFNNGIAIDMKYYLNFNARYAMMFDVQGFKELSFTVGAKGFDATLLVHNEKGETISSFDLKNGSLVDKKINLNGVKKVGFTAKFDYVKETKNNNRMYIYNPVLR